MSSTTDSTPEPGFEPALFWELHKTKIIIYAVILIVALAGFGVFQVSSSRAAAETRAMLANASSADDYRAIISKFPGSAEAGNATLLLAADLRKKGEFDKALELLRSFSDLYPTHSFASGALLSIAETLRAQGKTNEAIDAYQNVYSRYSTSFSAPAAMLARASLLRASGKIEEARRGYENMIAQYPESALVSEAREQLRLLK